MGAVGNGRGAQVLLQPPHARVRVGECRRGAGGVLRRGRGGGVQRGDVLRRGGLERRGSGV